VRDDEVYEPARKISVLMMSPPPSNKKLPKEDTKQILMGMARVSKKPLLVGVAAISLGVLWSLEEVEMLVQELVRENKLRPCNATEQVQFDVREGFLLSC